MSVALEEAPPPFMTESRRNCDTVSRGKEVKNEEKYLFVL
jgi:hypothetical protein